MMDLAVPGGGSRIRWPGVVFVQRYGEGMILVTRAVLCGI
jgi:hypothetical protein